MGSPFKVLIRLQIPAMAEPTTLCYFRLAWDDPDQPERQKLRVAFELPVVLESQLAKLPLNADVQREVAVMLSARAKKEATKKVDEGDYEGAMDCLMEARDRVLQAPSSLLMEQEAQSLVDLNVDLKARRLQKYRKRSLYEGCNAQRYWSQSRQIDYYMNICKKAVGDRIQVIQGDITQQKVEAIVCPSNESLEPDSGVAKAIHYAAGPKHQKARYILNGCEVGEAKIIRGYNLPAQWVIYTVGTLWNGGNYNEATMLSNCYWSCFKLAKKQGIRSIAFPGISTGKAGYPVDQATEIAVGEVLNLMYRMRSMEKAMEKVIFVCFNQETYLSYLAALK